MTLAAIASPRLHPRLHLATSLDQSPAVELVLDPRTAGAQKYGFIGRSGSGKSYAASKLVELLFRAGVPCIILDPVGNWYGLQIARDGGPGLDIPVIGGPHGDLPLDTDRAEELARWLVEHDGSAVIDLSELRKGDRKSFVTPFAEWLFHEAKRAKRQRMIVIEEAHVFAPQMAKGQERMLGAIEDICRLGRNYGLGSVLIDQRPQSVNKDVLNQVECLFVGQLSGEHERKAVQAWITEQRTAMPAEDLAKLDPGTFYCWSPQWLKWFGKVQVMPKTTLDASATPEAGEVFERTAKPNLKMDLDALRAVMTPPSLTKGKGNAKADIVAEAFLADEQLRADNEALLAELADRDELAGELRRRLDNAEATARSIANDLQGLLRQFEILREPVLGAQLLPPRAAERRHAEAAAPRPTPTPKPAPKPEHNASDAQTELAQQMLSVVALYGRCPDRVELAVACAVVHTGGYFRRVLKAVLDEGLLATTPEGNLMLTDKGRERQPRPPTIHRGAALAAEWCNRLRDSAPAILETLRLGPAAGLSSAEIALYLGGKSATGGYFRRGLKHLRGAGIIEGSPERWRFTEAGKILRGR